MSDRQVCMGCGCQIDEDGCGCEEEVLSDKAHCFRCGGPVDEKPRLDCVYLCGDCAGKDWHVETDKGPVVWRNYSKPQRTRLIEAVECGLSEEDRATLEYMREHFETYGEIYEDPLDFLDRLPRMVEDRDRELADAEYEVLCAKLEADTARQILADAIAKGRAVDVRPDNSLEAEDLASVWRRRAGIWKDAAIKRGAEIQRLRGLLDGESHG